MQALSRIAAVQDGASQASQAAPRGRAGGAAASPFLAMLAGLRAAGADRPAPAESGIAGEAKAASNAELKTAKAFRSGVDKAERASARGAERRSRATEAESPLRSSERARQSSDAQSGAQASARAGDSAAARSLATKNGGNVTVENDSIGKPADEAGARLRTGRGAGDGRTGAEALAASMAAGAARSPAASNSVVPSGRPAEPLTGAARRAEPGSSDFETLGQGVERGRNGARVRVVDMRLKAAKEGAGKQGSGQSSELPGESASSEAAKGELALSRDQGNPSALAGRAVPGTQGDYDIAAAKDVQAPQHSLSESLAARLRDGAADIVRSAQVFLKEGDSGVIRLRLEPESLGGVKIELKMTEKQISGKIVVESDIAGEAFRSSLDALKDAFAESGFETTALEVEVRNGMASGSGGERGGAGEDDGGPYWSRSLRELEAAVPPAAQTARDGVLNVIV